MARLTSDSGWKPVNRTVAADASVLAWVKWNPDYLYLEDGTTTATAARMQVQASLVNFDINTVAATTIGTYSGNTGSDDQVVFADAATIQGLIDYINGNELGLNNWIAGLGDFRPAFTIGTGDGTAVALSNIMLGRESDGLQIFADSSGLSTANIFSVGIGTPRAKRGKGQQIPDLAEYEYTSTVAGVKTNVRSPLLSRERHPATARFTTRITRIDCGQTFANSDNVVTVYDENSNVLFTETLGAATALDAAAVYDLENPICEAVGPIFVEAVGSGALTDGNMSVQGYIRIG